MGNIIQFMTAVVAPKKVLWQRMVWENLPTIVLKNTGTSQRSTDNYLQIIQE